MPVKSSSPKRSCQWRPYGTVTSPADATKVCNSGRNCDGHAYLVASALQLGGDGDAGLHIATTAVAGQHKFHRRNHIAR